MSTLPHPRLRKAFSVASVFFVALTLVGCEQPVTQTTSKAPTAPQITAPGTPPVEAVCIEPAPAARLHNLAVLR